MPLYVITIKIHRVFTLVGWNLKFNTQQRCILLTTWKTEAHFFSRLLVPSALAINISQCSFQLDSILLSLSYFHKLIVIRNRNGGDGSG